MTWFGSLADRFAAWYVHQIDGLAGINATCLMDAGALRYAELAAHAKRMGWGISKRKRKGAIIVIVEIPPRAGFPAMKFRLKFKPKP